MKDLIKYGLPWMIIVLIAILSSNILDFKLRGLGIGIITCITVVYYFNLDNPHRAYKKYVIICFIGWVISLVLDHSLNSGSWLIATMAALLSYIYFQRFIARENRKWIDYLKLAGVIALVPATYFQPVTPFIGVFLAFTYLLDRLIIRRQMNKTTQILTFSIMALLCLSFLIYSFIKADEAEKSAMEALLAQQEAEKQVEMSRQALQEAQAQAAIANQIKEELEACKASKN